MKAFAIPAKPPSAVAIPTTATACELAGTYRLFAQLGWHELIYNHITARVPGTERFLINPFGLMYREVTASNLLKIDLHGHKVVPSPYSTNPAGFAVHTHTTAGQVVSCQRDGLLPLSFTSVFYTGRLAYHDFEGITLEREQSQRLAADLGRSNVMILRNHGLLVCGASIADAFADHYLLQRACEVQFAAQATGAALIQPSNDIATHAAEQFDLSARKGDQNRMLFDAMLRWTLELNPDFCR